MLNMIIEDEWDLDTPIVDEKEVPIPDVEMTNKGINQFQAIFDQFREKSKAKMFWEYSIIKFIKIIIILCN